MAGVRREGPTSQEWEVNLGVGLLIRQEHRREKDKACLQGSSLAAARWEVINLEK